MHLTRNACLQLVGPKRVQVAQNVALGGLVVLYLRPLPMFLLVQGILRLLLPSFIVDLAPFVWPR